MPQGCFKLFGILLLGNCNWFRFMYDKLEQRSKFTIMVYDYLDGAPRYKLLELMGLSESKLDDRKLIQELGYRLRIVDNQVFFNNEGTIMLTYFNVVFGMGLHTGQVNVAARFS